MFDSLEQLRQASHDILNSSQGKISLRDMAKLKNTHIDKLIFTAIFASEPVKKAAREQIHVIAQTLGIYPTSIFEFYKAIGRGKIQNTFTVPAFNLRTLTYDAARLIFQIAMQKKAGPFIFEIARSEMGYTDQKPQDYAIAVLAAAIKEGYKGPIFLQGDHYQISAKKFTQDPNGEIETIKVLITKSIHAQFYNIDIDASTLVDLKQTNPAEQQKNNYEVTAQLTKFIRTVQPKQITISIGGEIGHIGGKNSTPEDMTAFMQGYLPLIKDLDGISKISVQTGTSHGGIPLPDGTIATVNIDFGVLETIGQLAKATYHLSGAVQHGASTLPNSFFDQFPKYKTLEIHLSTAFQNIIYDHLPQKLAEDMYAWVKENMSSQREASWTDEQFFYKLRKKALGPFKKQLWNLSKDEKNPILSSLQQQFSLLFDKLQLTNTQDLLQPYV